MSEQQLNQTIDKRLGQNIEQRYDLQFEDDNTFQVKQIHKAKHQTGIPPPYQALMQERNFKQQNTQRVYLLNPKHPTIIESKPTNNLCRKIFIKKAFLEDIRIYFTKYQQRFLKDKAFGRMNKQFFDEYPSLESLSDRIREVLIITYQLMHKQGLSFAVMSKRKVHFKSNIKNVFEHFIHELFYLYQERSKRQVILENNTFNQPYNSKIQRKDMMDEQNSSFSEVDIQSKEEQVQLIEICYIQVSVHVTFCQPALVHNVNSEIEMFSRDKVLELELQSGDMQIKQYHNRDIQIEQYYNF